MTDDEWFLWLQLLLLLMPPLGLRSAVLLCPLCRLVHRGVIVDFEPFTRRYYKTKIVVCGLLDRRMYVRRRVVPAPDSQTAYSDWMDAELAFSCTASLCSHHNRWY